MESSRHAGGRFCFHGLLRPREQSGSRHTRHHRVRGVTQSADELASHRLKSDNDNHGLARRGESELLRSVARLGTGGDDCAIKFHLPGLACGRSYRLGVIARAGALASARSSVVAHSGPCPSPPHNMTPPAVAGNAEVGMALTVASGMWPAYRLPPSLINGCDAIRQAAVASRSQTRLVALTHLSLRTKARRFASA